MQLASTSSAAGSGLNLLFYASLSQHFESIVASAAKCAETNRKSLSMEKKSLNCIIEETNEREQNWFGCIRWNAFLDQRAVNRRRRNVDLDVN